MAKPSPWPLIHAERQALLADVTPLTDEQWRTPSMCTGWSVADVFGHVIATARMTPPRFLGHLAASGFRFNKMVAKDLAVETQGPPAEWLDRFRSVIDRTTAPPGPVDTFVGEIVVHGEDIRRPLGIKRDYPIEAIDRTVKVYNSSNLLIGGKRRVEGLTLKATDADWSTGAGPEVTGPAVSLLLAMAGRKPALDDLSGEGLATLRARM